MSCHHLRSRKEGTANALPCILTCKFPSFFRPSPEGSIPEALCSLQVTTPAFGKFLKESLSPLPLQSSISVVCSSFHLAGSQTRLLPLSLPPNTAGAKMINTFTLRCKYRRQHPAESAWRGSGKRGEAAGVLELCTSLEDRGGKERGQSAAALFPGPAAQTWPEVSSPYDSGFQML